LPATQRLLIVDDDDIITLGLRHHLELRGSAVDAAHDYDTAKALAGFCEYAVVVLDLVVTGQSADAGIAFLQWLRDASPQTSVVILTAYRTNRLKQLATDLGVLYMFDKPKRFDEIVPLLVNLVSENSPFPKTPMKRNPDVCTNPRH
jgi:DNA-binding response OmpR family regulator